MFIGIYSVPLKGMGVRHASGWTWSEHDIFTGRKQTPAQWLYNFKKGLHLHANIH